MYDAGLFLVSKKILGIPSSRQNVDIKRVYYFVVDTRIFIGLF
jgi:hypothetical protein